MRDNIKSHKGIGKPKTGRGWDIKTERLGGWNQQICSIGREWWMVGWNSPLSLFEGKLEYHSMDLNQISTRSRSRCMAKSRQRLCTISWRRSMGLAVAWTEGYRRCEPRWRGRQRRRSGWRGQGVVWLDRLTIQWGRQLVQSGSSGNSHAGELWGNSLLMNG